MYFAKPVKQMNLCLQQSLFKCSKLSAGSEVSFNFVDFLKKSILHQYFQIFLKHFYLILPVHRLSLVAASRVYSSVVGHGLLTAVPPYVAVHGLSCPTACEIFLDQGPNFVYPALAGGFSITGSPGKSLLLPLIFLPLL